jgi:hypothetical protein
VVDIVHDGLLVEIQTGGFSAIKGKLHHLLAKHSVRLVYPVAHRKWILKLDDGATVTSRRRSPKHGRVEHVFEELVSFPGLMAREGFSLEVLLIHEEEVRSHQPGRRWRRRGWVTEERRLIDVVERRVLLGPEDMASLVPDGLPGRFTTADLADAIGCRRRLAQKMAYCLRAIDVFEPVGKQGNAILYERAA